MLSQTTFSACLAHSLPFPGLFKASLRLCHQADPTEAKLQVMRIFYHLKSAICNPAMSASVSEIGVSLIYSKVKALYFVIKSWTSRTSATRRVSRFTVSLLNPEVNPCRCDSTLWHAFQSFHGKDCWKQDKAPQTLLCWLREIPLG